MIGLITEYRAVGEDLDGYKCVGLEIGLTRTDKSVAEDDLAAMLHPAVDPPYDRCYIEQRTVRPDLWERIEDTVHLS